MLIIFFFLLQVVPKEEEKIGAQEHEDMEWEEDIENEIDEWLDGDEFIPEEELE